MRSEMIAEPPVHPRLGNRCQEAPAGSDRTAVSEAIVQSSPSVPAQVVQERAAKRRACAEEVPSTEQALAEWLCTKHLELRDALEIVSGGGELSQLLAGGP